MAPRGGWRSGQWGKYGLKWKPDTYSTKAGSGPWEGTSYLAKMPFQGVEEDYMYIHPDLYDRGPPYGGAMGLYGKDPATPAFNSGNLYRVNGACGTGGLLTDFRNLIVAHEELHRDSYNQCVENAVAMSQLAGRLERVAARDIRRAALDAVAGVRQVLVDAALTNQSGQSTPEGMWRHRMGTGKWGNESRPIDPHAGTIGC